MLVIASDTDSADKSAAPASGAQITAAGGMAGVALAAAAAGTQASSAEARVADWVGGAGDAPGTALRDVSEGSSMMAHTSDIRGLLWVTTGTDIILVRIVGQP